MARSLICSSYASPLASALAKIVGLEVTPRTWEFLIRAARLPVISRFLLMSSSQIDTPAWVSSSSTSLIAAFLLPSSSSLRDGCLGGVGYRLRGDAELLIDHGSRRRGAVVVDSDRLARVTDEDLPRRRDARLDRHPGLHRRREHILLVGSVLERKPSGDRLRANPAEEPAAPGRPR